MEVWFLCDLATMQAVYHALSRGPTSLKLAPNSADVALLCVMQRTGWESRQPLTRGSGSL